MGRSHPCDGGGVVSAQTPQPSPRSARKPPSEAQIRLWTQEILRLRSEVERLTSQIQIERAKEIFDLRSLESRRSQLQILVDQERLRLGPLRDRLQDLRQKALSQKADQTQIRLVWTRASHALETAIRESLPFRREERLRSILDLQALVASDRIALAQAFAQLWRLAEDELRLSVLVEKATIPLRLNDQGPRRLLPVVRLGLFALFIREAEDRYSRILRDTQGRWAYRRLTSEEIPHVRLLFEHLERQIREGFYRLPLAPPPASQGAKP